MSATAYQVRFKGHLVAAVKTGFSRKPILFRARAGEQLFIAPVPIFLESERPGSGSEDWEQLARLECARSIKRTEAAYRKLSGGGDHMLRGVKSVERLIQLMEDRVTPGKRRGKRWKIVPVQVLTT